jgi:chaperonin GroES
VKRPSNRVWRNGPLRVFGFKRATDRVSLYKLIRLGKEIWKMKLRPLHDRVIVKRIEEEGKTKGGIIIPETAKEKPIEGKVTAVGAGKILENGKKLPLQVKKGDRILFGKYAGTDIKIDGEEHLIMREDDIIAIVE